MIQKCLISIFILFFLLNCSSNKKSGEKTEIIKLNIRGNPNNKDFSSKVGKTLGIILPSEVGNVVSKEDISVITTGPNEWLVVSNNSIEKNNKHELENLLYENISKK